MLIISVITKPIVNSKEVARRKSEANILFGIGSTFLAAGALTMALSFQQEKMIEGPVVQEQVAVDERPPMGPVVQPSNEVQAAPNYETTELVENPLRDILFYGGLAIACLGGATIVEGTRVRWPG